jgi:hypothetical protein
MDYNRRDKKANCQSLETIESIHHSADFLTCPLSIKADISLNPFPLSATCSCRFYMHRRAENLDWPWQIKPRLDQFHHCQESLHILLAMAKKETYFLTNPRINSLFFITGTDFAFTG